MGLLLIEGTLEGRLDGDELRDGAMLGLLEPPDGATDSVGVFDGLSEGAWLGTSEGRTLGICEGATEGDFDSDGAADGASESPVGLLLTDGALDGSSD